MEDPYPSSLSYTEIFFSQAVLDHPEWIWLAVLLLLYLFFSGCETAFFSLKPDQFPEEVSEGPQKDLNFFIQRPRLLIYSLITIKYFTFICFIVACIISFSKLFTDDAELTGFLAVIVLIVFVLEKLVRLLGLRINYSYANAGSKVLNFISPLISSPVKAASFLHNKAENEYRKEEYPDFEDLYDEINKDKKEGNEDDKDILRGIFNFSNMTVRQVMRARTDVTAIDIENDFHELMDKINKSGYSRIPIYSETIDKIEGILYTKDLLPFVEKDEDFNWQSLVRAGYYVPESKKIDSLLKDFQDKRVHMAIVVDEYGGTAGLITLEDVIEEIVGEISDELDEDDIIYNKLDDNTYIFEGKTSLNDFCRIIDEDPAIFDEVKGDSESLGGLLLEINNKIPRSGEKINYKRFVFTVVSVNARRIKRVRILLKSTKKEKSKKKDKDDK